MSKKTHHVATTHTNRVRVEDEPEKRIVIRWFSSLCWGILFSCIIWDGIVVALLIGISKHGIFAIPFVAFGVALTYLTIAMFCNRTTIILTDRELRVYHWPIPWRGNKWLARKTIAHLSCVPGITITGSAGPYQTLANIKAISTNGRTCIFVRSLDKDDAMFVIQKLEKWLRQPPAESSIAHS